MRAGRGIRGELECQTAAFVGMGVASKVTSNQEHSQDDPLTSELTVCLFQNKSCFTNRDTAEATWVRQNIQRYNISPPPETP